MASYKEPCFFCDNQFFKLEDEYANLFSHISSKIDVVGEASTNYLAAPESPHRIKSYAEDAKIVIILRHPVERAFSLYKWMVRGGYEWAATFETALDLETSRQNDKKIELSPVKYNYNYFSSGLYYDQVTRYFNEFGKENCFVINFDDLKPNLDTILRQLYKFLGVNYYQISNAKIHNKAKFPLSPKVQYFLRNDLFNVLTIQKRTKNKMFGNPFVDGLAGLNSNLGKEPTLNKSTAGALQEKYEEDLVKLASILPFSIEAWQKKY
jgi:hypothetical protein